MQLVLLDNGDVQITDLSRQLSIPAKFVRQFVNDGPKPCLVLGNPDKPEAPLICLEGIYADPLQNYKPVPCKLGKVSALRVVVLNYPRGQWERVLGPDLTSRLFLQGAGVWGNGYAFHLRQVCDLAQRVPGLRQLSIIQLPRS